MLGKMLYAHIQYTALHTLIPAYGELHSDKHTENGNYFKTNKPRLCPHRSTHTHTHTHPSDEVGCSRK